MTSITDPEHESNFEHTSERIAYKSKLSEFLNVSLPIILMSVGNMVMNLMDTWFAGKISTDAIAATSLANAYFVLFIVVGFGLFSGFDYLISRDYGARKHLEPERWFILAYGIAIIFCIFAQLVMNQSGNLLRLIAIDEKLIVLQNAYIKPMSLSLFPIIIFMICRLYLQVYNRNQPVVFLSLIAIAMNYFLNKILIFGGYGIHPMGLKGSALATLISRIFMAFGMIYFVWKYKSENFKRLLRHKNFNVFTKKRFQEWSKIGLPAGFQMLIEVGAFSGCTLIAGKLGASSISSHQIVLQICSFTFMVPLGISMAAATEIGTCVGENNLSLAFEKAQHSIKIGVVINLFVGAALAIFSRTIMEFFTQDQSTIDIGIVLMRIGAFFQFFDAAQVIHGGVLRGFGETKYTLFSNIIGYWVVTLPLSYLFGLRMDLQITGVWIALTVGLILVATLLYFRLKVLKNIIMNRATHT